MNGAGIYIIKMLIFSVRFGTHSFAMQDWVFFGQLPSLVTCRSAPL